MKPPPSSRASVRLSPPPCICPSTFLFEAELRFNSHFPSPSETPHSIPSCPSLCFSLFLLHLLPLFHSISHHPPPSANQPPSRELWIEFKSVELYCLPPPRCRPPPRLLVSSSPRLHFLTFSNCWVLIGAVTSHPHRSASCALTLVLLSPSCRLLVEPRHRASASGFTEKTTITTVTNGADETEPELKCCDVHSPETSGWLRLGEYRGLIFTQ